MDGRANRTHWWTERWLRLWVALSLSLTHLSFYPILSIPFFLSHSFYPILSILFSLSLSYSLNVDIVFITLPQTFSGREAFQTFWLRNVLRATAACTFSTSQRPKVLRTWGVLRILIWKYAAIFEYVWSIIRPDGSAPAALASLLFDPPEPQNIEKNTVFRDFSTFSRALIFFLLTLSLLWSSFFFSSLLFSSLTLPTSAASSVHKSEVWLLSFLP